MRKNAHIWSMGAALIRASGRYDPLICREPERIKHDIPVAVSELLLDGQQNGEFLI